MYTPVFISLLILVIGSKGIKWPSGTALKSSLNSSSFMYSNFASLSIISAYITNDNANLYTVATGKNNYVDHFMVYKMNHNFSIQWSKWIAGTITHEGSDVSQDETSILLVPNSQAECVLWKLNSIDGGINIVKSIQGVNNWQSAKVINDKVIVAGRLSSNSIIVMLSVSNLGFVKAYTHPSDNTSFAYPYFSTTSDYNVLLGTSLNPTTSPATYQITSIDLTVSSKAMNWAIFGTESWVQTWLPANLPILSLIDQTNKRSYHILKGISSPYFFFLNLNSGSLLKGSAYIPSFSLSNMDVRDLSYSESQQTVFILLYYYAGFVIVNFDTSSCTFGASYK